MVNDEKRDFDGEATFWNNNALRVKQAIDIADAIRKEVPLTSEMDALDFGCGTGLVTLRLQPYIRSITGVDSSQGMLSVLEQKLKKGNLTNVETRLFDFEKGDVLEGRYHLIVSSMTFHHIREIKVLLDQFSRVALPSGYLCIADLDMEGGLFHGDNKGVFHFGFDREEIGQWMMEAGFDQVRHRTAATTIKPIHNGTTVAFNIFLATGRKSVADCMRM